MQDAPSVDETFIDNLATSLAGPRSDTQILDVSQQIAEIQMRLAKLRQEKAQPIQVAMTNSSRELSQSNLSKELAACIRRLVTLDEYERKLILVDQNSTLSSWLLKKEIRVYSSCSPTCHSP